MIIWKQFSFQLLIYTYIAGWGPKNITDPTPVSQTLIHSRYDAHHQRVAGTFFKFPTDVYEFCLSPFFINWNEKRNWNEYILYKKVDWWSVCMILIVYFDERSLIQFLSHCNSQLQRRKFVRWLLLQYLQLKLCYVTY